jgi:hypothetical protein
LEILSDVEEINTAWESIKTSGKEILGLHELKQHETWFDKRCLGFRSKKVG